MSDLVNFVIQVEPNGFSRIVLGEDDVSSRVRGWRIEGQPGLPPVLTIQEITGGGTIQGEGIVQIASENSVSTNSAIANFLSNIDPDLLEQEALNNCGMGDNLTAKMLEILGRWASGSVPE